MLVDIKCQQYLPQLNRESLHNGKEITSFSDKHLKQLGVSLGCRGKILHNFREQEPSVKKSEIEFRYIPGSLDVPQRRTFQYCRMTHHLLTDVKRVLPDRSHIAYLSRRARGLYRPTPNGLDTTFTDMLLENDYESVKVNEIWQKMAQDFWTFTIINPDPVHRILMIYKYLDENPKHGAQTQGYYKMAPGIERFKIFENVKDSFFEKDVYPQSWFHLDGDFVPKRIDFIASYNRFEQFWEKLQKEVNLPPGVRKPDLSFFEETKNDIHLPEDIVREICDIYDMDYCCLNLPAPEVCEFSCAWHSEMAHDPIIQQTTFINPY